MPDARIVRVPGASHFLPIEQPDVVRLELRLMARGLDAQAVNH
jgi:pimeloyl-ACP methyl ester carboxylesterase